MFVIVLPPSALDVIDTGTITILSDTGQGVSIDIVESPDGTSGVMVIVMSDIVGTFLSTINECVPAVVVGLL